MSRQLELVKQIYQSHQKQVDQGFDEMVEYYLSRGKYEDLMYSDRIFSVFEIGPEGIEYAELLSEEGNEEDELDYLGVLLDKAVKRFSKKVMVQ